MLVRRLLCRKQLWHASCVYMPVRHTQNQRVSQHALDKLNLEIRLPAPLKKQLQRKPFAKNLFFAVFDHEFMYYPEPQTKDRHQRFFEWLQPIEKYMSKCLENPQSVQKEDILAHLNELGVFRACLDEQHLGLNLNHSESAKLVEVLSCFPWLGCYMIKNYIVPVQIISKLASEEQKAKYLPRIATGELIPTVCLTEHGNRINKHKIISTATNSESDTHWLLNGEKILVVNGHDANLFLVFCHCGYRHIINDDLLSILLVERDFGGITIKDVKNLVGLQNNPVSTVTFKDTEVPKENFLGDLETQSSNILNDILSPGNRNLAPQAVGTLRAFTKMLTRHVLQRKHLDRNMHEYESVQEIIGKMASTLYGMESMLYYTTGIMDTFENQDCTLEKAMVEAYCTSECVARIYEGLQLIGSQSYLRENPYIQIFEDALSYILFENYIFDCNIYIALIGLRHTGQNLSDHIFKLRNPYLFPQYIFKWIMGKEYRIELKLADHLHPSFVLGSVQLEKCITRLQTTSILLLKRHGTNISERQMELRRIGELATRTFALITILSRASRAYCIGLRNHNQDKHLADSFAILSIDKVEALAQEIESGEWNNGDRFNKEVAELMYSKKDYFAEHPLNRTY
ncbi:Acyl-CoA dehydrogenase family member 9, mitochondrial [Trachymyrmex septentrionalis]|uniref:Acyl-CoA dehydrogenase family member 9, mitochondrial n=1 Tax=Trachymyrmex septentrionalis TaxID=34720 RepID=A0A195FTB2_9HYME|nr:PREDICTED: acyl-CoA dehydrogenase family member 9, mitochondrial-like [Trachymyrmex septentrionalis]KYN43693.1 Acyl-CoA dehydrogenase family member 9, mitochondrial [Trachymyrmex septentrionalis]